MNTAESNTAPQAPSHKSQLKAALADLAALVCYDVNGEMGAGGNGGLTSDETLRAAGEAKLLLARIAAADQADNKRQVELRETLESIRRLGCSMVELKRAMDGMLNHTMIMGRTRDLESKSLPSTKLHLGDDNE